MIKKAIITTFSLLLLANSFSYAQTTTEKTLVKSFNLQGKDVVVLDLDGEIEVKEWDNKIMRVQMTINVENVSNSMLKSLIQVGRYNLSSDTEDDNFIVFAPAMKKEIKVRGKVLKENIVYTVFTPENVTVKMADEASTSANSTLTVPSSK